MTIIIDLFASDHEETSKMGFYVVQMTATNCVIIVFSFKTRDRFNMAIELESRSQKESKKLSKKTLRIKKPNNVVDKSSTNLNKFGFFFDLKMFVDLFSVILCSV